MKGKGKGKGVEGKERHGEVREKANIIGRGKE